MKNRTESKLEMAHRYHLNLPKPRAMARFHKRLVAALEKAPLGAKLIVKEFQVVGTTGGKGS